MVESGNPRKTFRPQRKDRDTELFLYYGFVKNPNQDVYFKWQAGSIIEILKLQGETLNLINNSNE